MGKNVEFQRRDLEIGALEVKSKLWLNPNSGWGHSWGLLKPPKKFRKIITSKKWALVVVYNDVDQMWAVFDQSADH